MKKVKLKIEGMTCSACATHVQKAIEKCEKCSNINVNLLLSTAEFEIKDRDESIKEVITEIKKAGYGAKIYVEESEENIHKEDEKNILKKRVIYSLIFLIPLMIISMSHMYKDIVILDNLYNFFFVKGNYIIYIILQFVLLIPIIYLNRNYYISGFKKLIKRNPNMDSLVSLGSSAAIIYGIYSSIMVIFFSANLEDEIVQNYLKNVYLDSAAMVVTIVTIGKYLESISKGKTKDAISKLVNLSPKTCILLKDGKEEVINIQDLNIGDIIYIKPGDIIPIDGIVTQGSSLIDEANITGESLPKLKNVADKVISGSINKNGYLKIKAEKVGEDTTLSQIINLVKEASSSKAPISKMVDKVSFVFVPTVILISIIVTLIWLLFGANVAEAINFGISILVISCPCALGLATPVAIMVASGKAAENGIMIKDATSLEYMSKIDTVILDKTGTITEGKLKVTEIISNIPEDEMIQILASLEKGSNHPLSIAMLNLAKERNIALKNVTEFIYNTGKGIEGIIDNTKYFAGNLQFINEKNISLKNIENKKIINEDTVIYLANEKESIGVIFAKDVVREEAKDVISYFNKNNIKTIMLTGDNEKVAKNVASEIGINEFKAEMLPQDKEKYVKDMVNNSKKVAFVGDGVNDSPALSRATIGISINGGTDIAIDAADVVLMNNNLYGIMNAYKLSKDVMNNIKLSLFWAFIYNIIAMPIAAGALYNPLGIKLTPMIGSICMSLSSICVVTNALTVRKYTYNFGKEKQIMKKEIIIDGMMCNHCKMTVEKLLNSFEEISKTEVDLEKKIAKIELVKPLDDLKIIEKIQNEGFKVINIK